MAEKARILLHKTEEKERAEAKKMMRLKKKELRLRETLRKYIAGHTSCLARALNEPLLLLPLPCRRAN